jgi:predicted DNA-binding transcriptional regulator AlpA
LDKTQLLTTREVAEMLNVTQDGLRRWRREGQGPKAVKLSYHTLRYRLEDVEIWIEERTGQEETENDNHP